MQNRFNKKISTFRLEEIIYGFYYCRDKLAKYSKHGDKYLDVLLTDDDLSIYAKVWSNVNNFDKKFSVENFVAVKGKVVKYRDRLELNILNINNANSQLYSRYGFKSL